MNPTTLALATAPTRCAHAPALAAPVPTRRLGERIAQTLAFEFLGLVLIAPLYRAATGSSLIDSVSMVLAVAMAAALWCVAFNTVFDRVEARLSGRLASDRPRGLRIWHMVLCEATEVPVTCPVIYALSTMDLGHALRADVGLAAAYAVYGYCFYLAFDALCPCELPPSLFVLSQPVPSGTPLASPRPAPRPRRTACLWSAVTARRSANRCA